MTELQLTKFDSDALTGASARRIGRLSFSGAAYLASRLVNGLPLYPSETTGGSVARPSKTVLIVTPDTRSAEKLLSDAAFFLGNTAPSVSESNPEVTESVVQAFSAWEVLPFDALSPTVEISANRLYSLYRLLKKRPQLVVTTVEAMMQRIIHPETLAGAVLSVAVGQPLDRDKLIAFLDRCGYTRSSLVEEYGQMAVRGAVVDFFPPGARLPYRIELFSDAVESIRMFELSTQRSSQSVNELDIIPVREIIVPELFDGVDSGAGSAAGEDASSVVFERLRSRGLELDVPLREVKAVEEALSSAQSWPGIEHLYPLVAAKLGTLWDYLDAFSENELEVIVFDEHHLARAADDFENLVDERAKKAQDEGHIFPPPESAYQKSNESLSRLRKLATQYFDSLEVFTTQTEDNVKVFQGRPIVPNTRLISALQANRSKELPLEPLADEIKTRLSEGVHVAICGSHAQRIKRIKELLASYEIGSREFSGTFAEFQRVISGSIQRRSNPEVALLVGHLSSGFRSVHDRMELIADSDIFGESATRKKPVSTKQMRRFLGALSQFKEQDTIVHSDHGIGIYRGLRQVTVDGKVGDFLALEYAENAKLLLPVDHISKIQKYVGAEGKQPTLSKLGGGSWAKTKAKVRESVVELAGQLIKLYAQRELAPGFSFGPVDDDDKNFADSFHFEETPDQERAIEEVLSDMASSRPMDRLVCGDVGYGKTEVAMRAAFKAASAGKQAAILVPTTVLADQHYATFRERFSDFPVRVGCISRFFTKEQNKQTLLDLSEGKLDIIIGTHRLLQRDVIFKNLGLLIIDEEHRFGVAHKEKLKRMRRDIDVLTLTATPIPRTLHMSLVNIRDLSVIETPPNDRQVIRTHIANYDDSTVREAILRELSRSGQVFYIHNRVDSIAAVCTELSKLVPEARITFGHGQMKEDELEAVMHKFVAHEVDVLVSTTIVESGLDIPNANTIIIRHADRFGLAELYQLRGRVGRSSRRAYAYLLVSDTRTIGVDAKKRLAVLQTLDDLGMGFRLALQDMEIRGAGNLLGRDQSGSVHNVGFELYSKILKEAVAEIKLKGAPVENTAQPYVDPEVSIGFPAHIPPFYIPDVAERLILYQRLVDLKDEADGIQIAEEIEDRFGNMPREVELLVELMVFRSVLRQGGLVSANYRRGSLGLAFHPQARFNRERLIAVIKASNGNMKLTPAGVISTKLEEAVVQSPADLTREVRNFYRQVGI